MLRVIHAAAEQFARATECQLQRIPLSDAVEPRPDLLWESLLFAWHLMDRWALARLGFAGRKMAMEGIQSTLRERSDDEFVERLRGGFNAFQHEYEPFQSLLAGKGENLKGTLCWEFAKRICGQFSPDDLGSLILVSPYAANTAVFVFKCCDDISTQKHNSRTKER